MNFTEALAAAELKASQCRVAIMVEEYLDPTDAEAFNKAIFDPGPGKAVIRRAFKAATGQSIADTTLARHMDGECACVRDAK